MPRYVQQEDLRFKAIPFTIQVENYAMICAVMKTILQPSCSRTWFWTKKWCCIVL